MPSTIPPSFSLIGPAISESISDGRLEFSPLPKARSLRSLALEQREGERGCLKDFSWLDVVINFTCDAVEPSWILGRIDLVLFVSTLNDPAMNFQIVR